jgi:CBS domain-containing protein
MRVQELLDRKASNAIHTVTPEASVFDAVTAMVHHNVGAMLVVQNEALVGIITERDYLKLVTVKGRTARDTAVSDVMTRAVIYLTTESTLEEAMAICTEKRIRHLPVLKDEKVVGVLSIGDLVSAMAHKREMRIRTLEAYIADEYPGPSNP